MINDTCNWKVTVTYLFQTQYKWLRVQMLLQAWTNCAPDAYQARSGLQNLWDALDFLGAQFLLCKKQKKLLDLQVFSQIGKTMKKLQWISNAIMKTSLLVILWWSLHIRWPQNWFICSWIEKHLINCLRLNKAEV